jgi:hypothetical protein
MHHVHAMQVVINQLSNKQSLTSAPLKKMLDENGRQHIEKRHSSKIQHTGFPA